MPVRSDGCACRKPLFLQAYLLLHDVRDSLILRGPARRHTLATMIRSLTTQKPEWRPANVGTSAAEHLWSGWDRPQLPSGELLRDAAS